MSVQGSVVAGTRACTFSLDSLSEIGAIVTLLEYSFDSDLTGDVNPRAGRDGSWFSSQFTGGLSLELTLYVQAQSEQWREMALNNLLSLFVSRTPQRTSMSKVTLDFAELSKWGYFRTSGPAEVTRQHQTDAKVVIPLISPDPWLYGTENTASFIEETPTPPISYPITYPVTYSANPAGGKVEITSFGNSYPRATVTIYGPREYPGVQNLTTGEQVTYSSLTLVSGDVLVIDLEKRAATLNGVYKPADVTSHWFELDPYTSNTLQLTGSSTTSAGGMVTWYDSYRMV